MNPAFAAFAAEKAPRYNSFPPAHRFGPSIGPSQFSGWLSKLNPEISLSLYLHVPFCQEICWYCGCETFAARRPEPIEQFVGTLLAEIDLVADMAAARRVSSLVWGGGTPNILPVEFFALVLKRLSRRFDLSGLRRHAIEVDPRHLSLDLARAYADRGVGSVSLGVQDLNPHVQQAIGRVQPFAEVAAAFRWLRLAGIPTIGIDLMYGLPGQSAEDALASLEQVLGLGPERVAIFGYDHMPEHRSRQRRIDGAALPSPELRMQQSATMRSRLIEAGYLAVGIDHFARPDDELVQASATGTLRRDFHGYGLATGAAIIGLGPSAISELPQGYAQNVRTVTPWRKAVRAGGLATVKGHSFTADDVLRREAIQRLLCDFKVDLSRYGALAAAEPLARLEAAGMVRREGGMLSMHPEARPLARVVARIFDPGSKTGETLAL